MTSLLHYLIITTSPKHKSHDLIIAKPYFVAYSGSILVSTQYTQWKIAAPNTPWTSSTIHILGKRLHPVYILANRQFSGHISNKSH